MNIKVTEIMNDRVGREFACMQVEIGNNEFLGVT